MITTEVSSTASAKTIHELLVNVDAWSLWSPHVASVESPTRTVEAGWRGSTRAFFSPGATEMIVTEVRPNGGYKWHSALGPWRLNYDNAVESNTNGSILRFTAALSGPAAGIIERLVGPVSSFGQRRRMTRLANLAEYVETRTE